MKERKMYKDIKEKTLLLKAGSRYTFQTLIRDGCESLFMYGMAIEEDERKAKELVKKTYIKAWENRCGIKEGGMFDIWLKRMLIRESGLKEGSDKDRPNRSGRRVSAVFDNAEKEELIRQIMDECKRR